jgi:hypothetical protein
MSNLLDGEDVRPHPIWAAMLQVYDGAMTGDRARTDAVIAPEATMWDSHSMPLIRGRDELDAVRDQRQPGAAEPTTLTIEPHPECLRLFGDVAVLVHTFTVRSGQERFFVRNTSVWGREEERWLMQHNHEDVVEGQ